MSPWVVVVAMMLGAMLAGALWAGIAAAMRLVVKVNEAVSTMLLNYVALVHDAVPDPGPWKDPKALGQSTSVELNDTAKLPLIGGTQIHVGVIIAIVAAVAVWFALTRTTWGFRLSVVGGNGEAARRAGMPVVDPDPHRAADRRRAGRAGRLRPVRGHGVQAAADLRPTIGYVAFLASWLARHKPLPLLLASVVLAAIAVAGDSLQIDSGLPAASVNILMGLLLVAVLGWTSPRKAKS